MDIEKKKSKTHEELMADVQVTHAARKIVQKLKYLMFRCARSTQTQRTLGVDSFEVRSVLQQLSGQRQKLKHAPKKKKKKNDNVPSRSRQRRFSVYHGQKDEKKKRRRRISHKPDSGLPIHTLFWHGRRSIVGHCDC